MKMHHNVVMSIKALKDNAKSSDQNFLKVWTGFCSVNLRTDPSNHIWEYKSPGEPK